MEENNKLILENNHSIIEITEKAIDQFNLAKNTLEDKSKLALRITSSSRG